MTKENIKIIKLARDFLEVESWKNIYDTNESLIFWKAVEQINKALNKIKDSND